MESLTLRYDPMGNSPRCSARSVSMFNAGLCTMIMIPTHGLAKFWTIDSLADCRHMYYGKQVIYYATYLRNSVHKLRHLVGGREGEGISKDDTRWRRVGYGSGMFRKKWRNLLTASNGKPIIYYATYLRKWNGMVWGILCVLDGSFCKYL